MILKVEINGHDREALDTPNAARFCRCKQIVIELRGLGLA